MRIAAAILAIAATSATFAVSTTPAHAQTEDGTISIRYVDLNLASSQGRATLAARIDNAAERACGEAPVVNLIERQAVMNCHASVKASAWNQITAAARSGMIRGAR